MVEILGKTLGDYWKAAKTPVLLAFAINLVVIVVLLTSLLLLVEINFPFSISDSIQVLILIVWLWTGWSLAKNGFNFTQAAVFGAFGGVLAGFINALVNLIFASIVLCQTLVVVSARNGEAISFSDCFAGRISSFPSALPSAFGVIASSILLGAAIAVFGILIGLFASQFFPKKSV